jgi:hypothetical protein
MERRKNEASVRLLSFYIGISCLAVTVITWLSGKRSWTSKQWNPSLPSLLVMTITTLVKIIHVDNQCNVPDDCHHSCECWFSDGRKKKVLFVRAEHIVRYGWDWLSDRQREHFTVKKKKKKDEQEQQEEEERRGAHSSL